MLDHTYFSKVGHDLPITTTTRFPKINKITPTMPAQEKAMVEYRQTTAIALLISQIILIILYAALVEYGEGPKASSIANSDVDTFYPFYQDVHVMIFIGFGFLMTFLKKYVITMFLSIFVNKTSQAYNSYRIFNCVFFQFAMVRNGPNVQIPFTTFFLGS